MWIKYWEFGRTWKLEDIWAHKDRRILSPFFLIFCPKIQLQGMGQNRKLSHFLCSGPNFQFTCSGPNLLNDLKIGVVFNLCCRLGLIPVFKSLPHLAASYNFTHIPLYFLHFCNMSLVKFAPFHHCCACGNATWMPSPASCTVFLQSSLWAFMSKHWKVFSDSHYFFLFHTLLAGLTLVLLACLA